MRIVRERDLLVCAACTCCAKQQQLVQWLHFLWKGLGKKKAKTLFYLNRFDLRHLSFFFFFCSLLTQDTCWGLAVKSNLFTWSVYEYWMNFGFAVAIDSDAIYIYPWARLDCSTHWFIQQRSNSQIGQQRVENTSYVWQVFWSLQTNKPQERLSPRQTTPAFSYILTKLLPKIHLHLGLLQMRRPLLFFFLLPCLITSGLVQTHQMWSINPC